MRVHVHQLDGPTTMRTLPLAAGLLVATARRHPRLAAAARFEVVTERLPAARLLAERGPAEVFAYSLYAWSARASLAAARAAKAACPEALMVAGGPSVPRRPDAARRFLADHPALDVLVFGEGELAFRDLLLARLDGAPLDGVPGLALRAPGGEAVLTAPRPRVTDFSETGSPYLDGTFEPLLARRGLPDAAVLETNRGCPFACTFCDWGQATASRVHELPLDRVLAEITWAAERGVPYLYLVDANFGIRRRDVAIVRHVAAEHARTGFPRFCFFHLTKNATERNLATVEVLRDAGVGCQVALSMQDFDPAVLAAVKRANIHTDEALRLRRLCHARGIPTFNEILLGLPGQTLAGFALTVVRAMTPFPGDTFFLYPCRVLENAELGEPASRARFGLETRLCAVPPADGGDGTPPEVEEVVVATAALPPPDWERAFALGHLAAAAYDHGLLDVVLRALRPVLGEEGLAAWLLALGDAALAAPPATALGALGATVRRHVASIRAGGPLALPVPGASPARRECADALLMVALADAPRLLGEVHALTRAFLGALAAPPAREADPAWLDDLFRYQAFVVPAPGEAAPREAAFAHDWPAWLRAGCPAPGPEARPVRLVASPPPTPPPRRAPRPWPRPTSPPATPAPRGRRSPRRPDRRPARGPARGPGREGAPTRPSRPRPWARRAPPRRTTASPSRGRSPSSPCRRG